MKKLIIVFGVLLVAFCGVWIFKSKVPISRPEADVSLSDNWWDNPSDIPVADDMWILDPEIPSNYIPVIGENELYMVVDDSGNILEYRQRTREGDDTWIWQTVNPDIPNNYTPVNGLEDVYKVTDEKGNITYLKYIRNADDTFAFVKVDENGNIIDDVKDGSSSIPDDYHHIANNVYAVYNEHGVLIGYKERKLDENGQYYWVDATAPATTTAPTQPVTQATTSPTLSGGNQGSQQGGQNPGGNQQTVPSGSYQQSDGKYIETETIISTETKGGWVITYQTVVTRTYSSDGTLLSTQRSQPQEISRVKASSGDVSAPDPSRIASTLSAEYARVSVGQNYHTELAYEVLAAINADRASSGASALTMDASSNAYKLSAIRATDMANNNHSDYDSPLYGTLAETCSRFGVVSSAPNEILWKTTNGKSAEAIASRLLLMSNGSLSTGSYQSIGISIVSKSGYYYVNLIIL